MACDNLSTFNTTNARRWLLGIGAALLVMATGGVIRADDDDDVRVRWDIVSIDFVAGAVSAGGHASAMAADGSKITLTGRGTFVASEDDDGDDGGRVTGGGTWRTSDGHSGKYWVSGLVSWHRAPGTFPPLTDRIGGGEPSAGLAVLRIRYDDGSDGILAVSCHLIGTPDSVFEGITASKGFVDYYNAELPVPGVDANRTLFHVRTHHDDH